MNSFHYYQQLNNNNSCHILNMSFEKKTLQKLKFLRFLFTLLGSNDFDTSGSFLIKSYGFLLKTKF